MRTSLPAHRQTPRPRPGRQGPPSTPLPRHPLRTTSHDRRHSPSTTTNYPAHYLAPAAETSPPVSRDTQILPGSVYRRLRGGYSECRPSHGRRPEGKPAESDRPFRGQPSEFCADGDLVRCRGPGTAGVLTAVARAACSLPLGTDRYYGMKTVRRPGVSGAIQVASRSVSGTGRTTILIVPLSISSMSDGSSAR